MLPPASATSSAGSWIIFLRQKTPPFRAGDEWRSSSPCATLPAYRRACGNLRLWSGADNQGPNERVSRSQRFAFGRACLVRCVQPRNPLPLGMGRGQYDLADQPDESVWSRLAPSLPELRATQRELEPQAPPSVEPSQH